MAAGTIYNAQAKADTAQSPLTETLLHPEKVTLGALTQGTHKNWLTDRCELGSAGSTQLICLQSAVLLSFILGLVYFFDDFGLLLRLFYKYMRVFHVCSHLLVLLIC